MNIQINEIVLISDEPPHVTLSAFNMSLIEKIVLVQLIILARYPQNKIDTSLNVRFQLYVQNIQ